jgi:hypothetical protein
MNRRSCLSSLTAVILVGSLLLGIEPAFGMSTVESASLTLLYPAENLAWYHTYTALGVISTADGPAYAISSETDWYTYTGEPPQVGTQLTHEPTRSAHTSVQ